ncbi:hypothetical protein O5853_26850 [Escherichia coli]|nr:hypothetical protein [Escherichia coli]
MDIAWRSLLCPDAAAVTEEGKQDDEEKPQPSEQRQLNREEAETMEPDATEHHQERAAAGCSVTGKFC